MKRLTCFLVCPSVPTVPGGPARRPGRCRPPTTLRKTPSFSVPQAPRHRCTCRGHWCSRHRRSRYQRASAPVWSWALRTVPAPIRRSPTAIRSVVAVFSTPLGVLMHSSKTGELMTHRNLLLTCAGMALAVVLIGPVAAAGGSDGGGAMRGRADGDSGPGLARQVQKQARERHEVRERVRDGDRMEKSKEKSKALDDSNDRRRERERDRGVDSVRDGKDHRRSRESDRSQELVRPPADPGNAERSRRRWWWPFGN